MAFFKFSNVAIRGLSGCVPKNVEENANLPFYKSGEAEQIIEKIGIVKRHIAPDNIAVSDLCYHAADKLISELGWEKESIDLIALCTQNPDYLNHPTSFLVHERLGLSESTMCLDFYHGCPGWVVSLSSVASLISSGNIKRALLLDGDTVTKNGTPNNREERPLFGDAGIATALEFNPKAKPIFFNIGTKSDDGRALIRPIGGFRHPYTMESLQCDLDRRSGKLSMEGLQNEMDSMDIFSFAITKVPKAIKTLCGQYGLEIDNIDRLVLHQANKVILEAIAKRLKVPMDKVLLGLRDYGNTTSASVPLAIITECSSEVRNSSVKCLICGFGTGLAFGAAYMELSDLVCPEVIEI